LKEKSKIEEMKDKGSLASENRDRKR